MKLIIKTIVLSMLIISSLNAIGQETQKAAKTKEFYLAITDLIPINFSIKYKQQIGNRTFFKIGLVDLSANKTNNSPSSPAGYSNSSSSYSVGLECGIEFRKDITDKVLFFNGPNTNFSYRTGIRIVDNPNLTPDQRKDFSETYNPGISYTLGFLVKLNDHFLLAAELNPSVNFSFNKYNNTTSTSTNFGLSNKSGLLSIAYRL